MHLLIRKNENVFICLGIPNQSIVDLTFFCSCHSESLAPTLIRQPQDWRGHIDVCNSLWPLSSSSLEHKRLSTAIELTIERYFFSFHSTPVPFLFNDDFLQSLLAEITLRENVLYAMSKRLLMRQQEACSDAGLNDEPVRGQEGIRRFYVSDCARIHYEYSVNGRIRFLQYYGPGCHDDGL